MALFMQLKDAKSQLVLSAALKKGLEYLLKFDPKFFQGKEDGFSEKVVIDGENVFANHSVYKTKPVSKARFEAHRKYIDLQIIWQGQENIEVTSLDNLKNKTKYDPQKDIVFYKFFKAASLIMNPGYLAVLYPTDAHAPGVSSGCQKVVFKTVVKVKIKNKKKIV